MSRKTVEDIVTRHPIHESLSKHSILGKMSLLPSILKEVDKGVTLLGGYELGLFERKTWENIPNERDRNEEIIWDELLRRRVFRTEARTARQMGYGTLAITGITTALGLLGWYGNLPVTLPAFHNPLF